MDYEGTLWFVIVFLASCFIVTSCIASLSGTKVSELGNAICSESHQGKFISYSDKIVKCESIKETIKYDGIRIEIEKGEKQ